MLGYRMSLFRWVTLVSGLMECLCYSGIYLGWTSLVFILKTEGYFSDLCLNTTGANSTVFTDCSAQDSQLSLVITIGMWMSAVLSFPMGFIFDNLGTMVTRILSISIHTTGSLLLAFSSRELPLLIFPAVSCHAVAGLVLLTTNMQTSNLFGSHRSIIITLYSGIFDSSQVIFLIIKVLYENGISLRSSFLFMAACSVIHLLQTFLLLPKTHIPYPLPEDYTYGYKLQLPHCTYIH
ncbi:hypothetical protein SKAU_G00320120 [Synaphobranchus kaupii]|uniref:Major facilitator superfamily (MFS) profile domain-containing protein n=1 Tax=Synaphobranchus kaupii TaxID=118154 RepID=A0A9Q1ENL8_SYNKA|nr:hypothetical protein SKAU_G00320120 [Synaphobranchus kaupii]